MASFEVQGTLKKLESQRMFSRWTDKHVHCIGGELFYFAVRVLVRWTVEEGVVAEDLSLLMTRLVDVFVSRGSREHPSRRPPPCRSQPMCFSVQLGISMVANLWLLNCSRSPTEQGTEEG